jgi:predicted RNase H-like HicB family nuclease
MSHYFAAFEPDGKGGFGVFFPDLPGLGSAGDSREEAFAGAIEALSGHIAAMRDDGDVIPPPRSLDGLLADAEVALDVAGCVLALVPLLDVGGAQVRVNISASRREIESIDEAAKARGLTRSAFLIAAARDKIASEGR